MKKEECLSKVKEGDVIYAVWFSNYYIARSHQELERICMASDGYISEYIGENQPVCLFFSLDVKMKDGSSAQIMKDLVDKLVKRIERLFPNLLLKKELACANRVSKLISQLFIRLIDKETREEWVFKNISVLHDFVHIYFSNLKINFRVYKKEGGLLMCLGKSEPNNAMSYRIFRRDSHSY